MGANDAPISQLPLQGSLPASAWIPVSVVGDSVTRKLNISLILSAIAGKVALTGDETVQGVKTFSNGIKLPSLAGTQPLTLIVNPDGTLDAVEGSGGSTVTLQNAFDASVAAGDNPQISTFRNLIVEVFDNKGGDNKGGLFLNSGSVKLYASDENEEVANFYVSQNEIGLKVQSNRFLIQDVTYAFPTTQANTGDVLTATSIDGDGKAILQWQPVGSGGSSGNYVPIPSTLISNSSLYWDGSQFITKPISFQDTYSVDNTITGNNYSAAWNPDGIAGDATDGSTGWYVGSAGVRLNNKFRIRETDGRGQYQDDGDVWKYFGDGSGTVNEDYFVLKDTVTATRYKFQMTNGELTSTAI